MILEEAAVSRLEAAFCIALERREHSEVEVAHGAPDRAVIAWLRALDRGDLARAGAGRDAPPVWIYDQFKWGPHPWPVRWRDLPDMPYTDCGLMAALSTAVFQWRGLTALPVQLILHFNPESARGWGNLWDRAGLGAHWCAPAHAYHEVTGVIDERGFIRFWDALGRFWLPVSGQVSYENIAALRLCAPPETPRLARIGDKTIISDRWYAVPDALRSGDTANATSFPACQVAEA